MRLSIILLVLVISAAAAGVAGCGSDSGGASASGAGAIVSVAKVDGTDVLADSAGNILYSAAVEKGGQIHCVGACASSWKPMPASPAEAEAAAAELDANLGVVKRPDGEEQLTLDGLPLYTFAEEGAGELDGDGFADDFQGTHFVWKAARTNGASAPSDGPSSGYGY